MLAFTLKEVDDASRFFNELHIWLNYVGIVVCACVCVYTYMASGCCRLKSTFLLIRGLLCNLNLNPLWSLMKVSSLTHVRVSFLYICLITEKEDGDLNWIKATIWTECFLISFKTLAVIRVNDWHVHALFSVRLLFLIVYSLHSELKQSLDFIRHSFLKGEYTDKC